MHILVHAVIVTSDLMIMWCFYYHAIICPTLYLNII